MSLRASPQTDVAISGITVNLTAIKRHRRPPLWGGGDRVAVGKALIRHGFRRATFPGGEGSALPSGEGAPKGAGEADAL